MGNIVIVPQGWVIYDVEDDVLDVAAASAATAAKGSGAPSISVMEALVMMGKAKRTAAIHTFNSMDGPDGDDFPEGGSPFYTPDDEGDV